MQNNWNIFHCVHLLQNASSQYSLTFNEFGWNQQHIQHISPCRTRREEFTMNDAWERDADKQPQRHTCSDASASPHRLSYPGSERGRQHGKQKRVTGLLAAKETERYDFHYSSLHRRVNTATLKRSADFIWLFSASERRCREIHTDHKRATNEKIIKRCIVGKK